LLDWPKFYFQPFVKNNSWLISAEIGFALKNKRFCKRSKFPEFTPNLPSSSQAGKI
jgi:hypothetical protein